MKKWSARFSDDPDAASHIERCSLFFCIVTPLFLKDKRAMAEKELALSYDKPVFVALKKGTVLPRRFLEGATNTHVCIWKTEEDLVNLVKKATQWYKEIQDESDEPGSKGEIKGGRQ